MKINYRLNKNQIKSKLGIEPNGRIQNVIDHKLVDYLREYEPSDTTLLQMNTTQVKPGLVVVATPYAHYQNEGIVYEDPKYHKGAFHDPISGRFWSRPSVGKIPSDRKFSTYGSVRGPHFVERTIKDKTQDIIRDAKEAVNNGQ